MVFRRSFSRGLNLRPVNRIKHVRDEQGALVPGTQNVRTIIDTSDTPTLAQTQRVETGSKVHGVFLKVEATRTGTTSDVLPNVYMFVMKNPGGNLTAPQANTVGADDNKRFVIHQEMVMLQGFNAGNPRTLFSGVIVIPRGYSRFGPNDLLQLGLLSPGVNINWCYQAHFKEFR